MSGGLSAGVYACLSRSLTVGPQESLDPLGMYIATWRAAGPSWKQAHHPQRFCAEHFPCVFGAGDQLGDGHQMH